MSAIHEAGHAVVVLSQDRGFDYMTESALYFRPDDPAPDLSMIHLGGVAAHLLNDGDGGPEVWERATVDWREAKRWAKHDLEQRGLEPSPDAVLRQLAVDWGATLTLLIAHWPAVKALARLIEREGAVTCETARYIFEAPMTG